jgi:hypothetical protein
VHKYSSTLACSLLFWCTFCALRGFLKKIDTQKMQKTAPLKLHQYEEEPSSSFTPSFALHFWEHLLNKLSIYNCCLRTHFGRIKFEVIPNTLILIQNYYLIFCSYSVFISYLKIFFLLSRIQSKVTCCIWFSFKIKYLFSVIFVFLRALTNGITWASFLA